MALHYCPLQTNEFKKKLQAKGRKQITVWKYMFVYRNDDNTLTIRSPIRAYINWKPGENVDPARENPLISSEERNRSRIYHGFHVTLNWQLAHRWAKDHNKICSPHQTYVRMKFTAYLDDLVGVDNENTQAVFTKLHIDPNYLNDLLKKVKKKLNDKKRRKCA